MLRYFQPVALKKEAAKPPAALAGSALLPSHAVAGPTVTKASTKIKDDSDKFPKALVLKRDLLAKQSLHPGNEIEKDQPCPPLLRDHLDSRYSAHTVPGVEFSPELVTELLAEGSWSQFGPGDVPAMLNMQQEQLCGFAKQGTALGAGLAAIINGVKGYATANGMHVYGFHAQAHLPGLKGGHFHKDSSPNTRMIVRGSTAADDDVYMTFMVDKVKYSVKQPLGQLHRFEPGFLTTVEHAGGKATRAAKISLVFDAVPVAQAAHSSTKRKAKARLTLGGVFASDAVVEQSKAVAKRELEKQGAGGEGCIAVRVVDRSMFSHVAAARARTLANTLTPAQRSEKSRKRGIAAWKGKSEAEKKEFGQAMLQHNGLEFMRTIAAKGSAAAAEKIINPRATFQATIKATGEPFGPVQTGLDRKGIGSYNIESKTISGRELFTKAGIPLTVTMLTLKPRGMSSGGPGGAYEVSFDGRSAMKPYKAQLAPLSWTMLKQEAPKQSKPSTGAEPSSAAPTADGLLLQLAALKRALSTDESQEDEEETQERPRKRVKRSDDSEDDEDDA